ncbi:MAG: SH3 domain-containing protein [Planctomycetaceae bacterium]|nr:SH3 domain-containing protein [Planctomycetales bacterium]MCB9940124.1 SH3 domain-containing protein [Planctomycetaceae bacterium]
MRATSVVSLIVLLAAAATLAEESFPYKVAVKSREVTVRSGPGSQFYVTGQIEAGDEIEVYERKGGGWLGIRPPKGSFNWVEASKLRMTNDPDVAKVVGNNVVAWVGSESDTDTDHKWQVKLDPGESVQLMSRQSMSIFRGDELRDFYQIAPPAGEFRWVQERDIDPLKEQASATNPQSEIQLAQFQVVAEEISETPAVTDGFVARDDVPTETEAARVASLAPRTDFRPSENRIADFDSMAKMLDIRLSETVAQRPTQWKLAALRQEAEALLEQSDTTLHRGKARLILENIKEFERLQLSYAGIADPNADEFVADSPATNEASPTSDATDFDPRFDGRGWLLPVHSSHQASPPYALLDQQGQILSFVSPAPGLNLHRYLRKEVGIFGQRSRAEFLKKPHLTADRIVDMERHRR